MKPVIEIKGLSKRYRIHHQQKAQYRSLRDDLVGLVKKPFNLLSNTNDSVEDFWALKDISFDVNKGDSVGIIGRNGSGKSTLLKILSRIVDPTDGEAILRGKSASLLEVGTGFHPELTGRENIYFNGSILGMTKKEITSKFDEIVAFAETEKFLDTPVKFYSSGMYVRLAFAVAAHLDPDILIVDEVLAVGDAAFQKKCLGKMQDVAGQGRTVLFVSHNLSAVKSLCNRGVWLDKGKIIDQGDIDQVTDNYLKHSIAYDDNLATRRRPGNVSLEAKITKVTVTTSGGQKGAIDSSKPTEITFEITSEQNLEREALVHCGIVAGDRMVLRFMSEFTSNSFKLKKGRNVIKVKTEPTFLTGGVYSLDASILYPGRETMGHIDEVPDATVFTVQDLLVPGSGDLLTQREATYYAGQTWSRDE